MKQYYKKYVLKKEKTMKKMMIAIVMFVITVNSLTFSQEIKRDVITDRFSL